ncbi:MAG TPA: ImmA/IrrE family metallo-endopeptidase [Acetobacteraceae bacterium]|nr:ImmA/IrrE family metallo-endopeptidase [Acetobacteraceae bacterium]
MSGLAAPTLPSRHRERTPMEIAGSYLQRAPVDLSGMAAALGLAVNMNATMPAGLSGRIIRGGDGAAGYRIEINGAHSSNRKRFTLAHEIAHYLLHRDMIGDGVEDSALYRSRLSSATETEANRLAADLLMPAPLLRTIYNAGVRWTAGLTRAFEVSEEAMAIRLRQLRLAP